MKDKRTMGQARGWLWAGMLLLSAEAFAGDFTYVTNADDTITVAAYSGGDDFVVVPADVGGKPVTVIGDGAFYCGSLSGISLPGTGEVPVAPVYVDGEKTVTLKGETIAADFSRIVDDYVVRRYGKAAG